MRLRAETSPWDRMVSVCLPRNFSLPDAHDMRLPARHHQKLVKMGVVAEYDTRRQSGMTRPPPLFTDALDTMPTLPYRHLSLLHLMHHASKTMFCQNYVLLWKGAPVMGITRPPSIAALPEWQYRVGSREA